MGSGDNQAGTAAPRRFTVEHVRPAGPGQHFATNPRAGGKAAGLELLFMGVNFVLQWIGGRQARNALQEQLNSLSRRVEQDIADNPRMGVLLRFHYVGGPSHRESIIRPVYRYGYVTYGRGHTISEARRHAERHGHIRSNGNWVAVERWFKPTLIPSVTSLSKPYRKVARATFVAGRSRLQNVKYGGIQGFDDESTYDLPNATSPNTYLFDILQPPKAVILTVGTSGGPVDVPLRRKRPSGGGPAIPVVSLDSVLGSATAALVFPANDFTDKAFRRAPATSFEANISMRHRVNISRARWVRPEDVRVIT